MSSKRQRQVPETDEGVSPALRAWKATCLRFFTAGTDKAAQAALDFFTEQCNLWGGDAAEVPKDYMATVLLHEAGLLNANNQARTLSVEEIRLYVATKDAARQEAHVRSLDAKRARLKDLLAIDSHPLPAVTTMDGFRMAHDRLKIFVTAHRDCVGAHPFLKGIKVLLQKQLNQEYLLCWHIGEDVLIESGASPVFTIDAIDLLAANFCRMDVSIPDTYGWMPPHDVSDRRLQQLQSLLPADANLHGVPTGSILLTEQLRTNVDGDLDEYPGCCSCACS